MGKKLCHGGHRERLRKRYLDFGAESFHEHELLELILFYGIPRKNTNEIAHQLISEFGDIAGVLNASSEELTKVDGIGNSAALFLKFLNDICKEYDNYLPMPSSPEVIEDFPMYFRDCFKDTAQEMCLILCPGTNFRIAFPKEKVLNNTDDMVHITNQLLKRECSKVIIAINRTASPAAPMQCDIKLVNLFTHQLSLLGINLIDLLIIGKKRSFSLLYDGAFSF